MAEPTRSPTDPEIKRKFENKQNSEYFDPCQEAASRSLKCLHRNGGDREMCSDYFQAYRDCKKQWVWHVTSSSSWGVIDRVADYRAEGGKTEGWQALDVAWSMLHVNTRAVVQKVDPA